VPSPSAFPTNAPTKTACQIIDGSVPDVSIDDNDCKVWKVTGLFDSLTVPGIDALVLIEGVDVTFSGQGGVSDFLAVGDEGGAAEDTNIAVANSVDGNLNLFVGPTTAWRSTRTSQ
jgi:hypothetical protein